MRRFVVVAVLLATSAFAEERVRIAVHPLAAPGVDDAKLVIELNREQLNILAETQHLTLAAIEDVERRLAEEGGRCPAHGKERIECLERVALATRATYSIAVTVKRLGNDFELSATIADPDRVPLEQPATLSCAGNGAVKPEVALKAQLRALLLDIIKAGTLPSDPRKLSASAVPPPLPPLEFKSDEHRPTIREPAPQSQTGFIGKITMGVGGASVIAGIVLLSVAGGERAGIHVDPYGNIPLSQMGNVQSTGVMQNVGGACVGFGLATVAAGGLLWLMSATGSSGGVTLAPTPGGAAVVFRGELP